MERFILAIDHGTSGIKAAIVSERGAVLDAEFVSTPTLYLPGGGAEQDPQGWWDALVTAVKALRARGRVSFERIELVGVSSTFSTTVAVDSEGEPVMPAITWLDSRGSEYVRAAMRGFPSFQGYGITKVSRWVRRTGGAPALSGKDDAAHVLLVKHAFPKEYARARWFLSSKDYLTLRLTGEVATSPDAVQLFYVTDTRDANNIRYDDGLIRGLGIDREKLPPLRASTEELGTLRASVADELGLPRTARVAVGAADMASALVGSGAVRDYQGHLYIGTSSWVQCPVPFRRTDVLHQIACFPTAVPGRYQVVNEQDYAGGSVDFLVKHVLERAWGSVGAPLPKDPFAVMEQVAGSAPAGSNRLIFTPWLNGERTPVDDTHLRGGWHNLSTTTTLEDMARSVLEGVAYNIRWSLHYVDRFVKRKLEPLRFIGGGAQSDTWCQVLSDVLDREIHRVADPRQANGRGAALIAAVGAGWVKFDEIPDLVRVERAFSPDPANRAIYDEMYGAFRHIHKRNRGVYRRLNKA
ncbi:MAG: FGGY-family carbohydrate kinase [Actinomycetota bacterium]